MNKVKDIEGRSDEEREFEKMQEKFEKDYEKIIESNNIIPLQ
jgi:hypothetical protein